MVNPTAATCQVWDFETIDNADITDENAAFEMDPLTEIRVNPLSPLSQTSLLHIRWGMTSV